MARQQATSQSKPQSASTSTPADSYLYQKAPKSGKLKQPDRSGPNAPTLYDIAAEREAELVKAADAANAARARGSQHKSHETTTPRARSQPIDAEPTTLERVAEAALYAISLSMIQFTFDVLVHHQYAQEMDWAGIRGHFSKAIFVFWGIVFVVHSFQPERDDGRFFVEAKQAGFFAAAVVAGCKLVWSGNQEPYYAVMELAPGIGTVLVWCVFEMRLPWALGAIACVGAYVWWYGLSLM